MKVFLVRDLTRTEPSVSWATREEARRWVAHLWEWKLNSRPVIEEIDDRIPDQKH